MSETNASGHISCTLAADYEPALRLYGSQKDPNQFNALEKHHR